MQIQQDEVLKMAKQAQVHEELCGEHFIYEFAKLVASAAIAKEREACIELIKSHGPTLANGFMLTEAIRARGEA